MNRLQTTLITCQVFLFLIKKTSKQKTNKTKLPPAAVIISALRDKEGHYRVMIIFSSFQNVTSAQLTEMRKLSYIVLSLLSVTGLCVDNGHGETGTNYFDIRINLARIPKTQTYYVCQQFQVNIFTVFSISFLILFSARCFKEK